MEDDKKDKKQPPARVACNHCRWKKTRCAISPGQTSCKSCLIRGLMCQFGESHRGGPRRKGQRKKSAVGQRQYQSLRKRQRPQKEEGEDLFRNFSLPPLQSTMESTSLSPSKNDTDTVYPQATFNAPSSEVGQMRSVGISQHQLPTGLLSPPVTSSTASPDTIQFQAESTPLEGNPHHHSLSINQPLDYGSVVQTPQTQRQETVSVIDSSYASCFNSPGEISDIQQTSLEAYLCDPFSLPSHNLVQHHWSQQVLDEGEIGTGMPWISTFQQPVELSAQHMISMPPENDYPSHPYVWTQLPQLQYQPQHQYEQLHQQDPQGQLLDWLQPLYEQEQQQEQYLQQRYQHYLFEDVNGNDPTISTEVPRVYQTYTYPYECDDGYTYWF